MVVGCKLKHRRRCKDYNRNCKNENFKLAHKWSDKRNKSNNLPVITAATEPAETKPTGAVFVKHNSPSYNS